MKIAGVVLAWDKQTPRLRCQRCGEEYLLELPIEISVIVSLSETFSKLHSECKEGKQS